MLRLVSVASFFFGGIGSVVVRVAAGKLKIRLLMLIYSKLEESVLQFCVEKETLWWPECLTIAEMLLVALPDSFRELKSVCFKTNAWLVSALLSLNLKLIFRHDNRFAKLS